MSLWDKKESLDEFLFTLDNMRSRARLFWYKHKYKELFGETNEVLSDLKKKKIKHATVVANGPSSLQAANGTDLTIFFNFGFRHSFFPDSIDPVLAVVDTKLANGTWSLDMLYEAKERNQTVIFAIGAFLLSNPDVRQFIRTERCVILSNYLRVTRFSNLNKSFQLNGINFGGGATEQGLALAACLGAVNIDLFGFDGNNVILGLAGLDTHFYGVDPLKNWSDPRFVARELRFLSYFIDHTVHLSAVLREQKVRVTNHSMNPYMETIWKAK